MRPEEDTMSARSSTYRFALLLGTALAGLATPGPAASRVADT